ncbi:MAG: SDR family NAD(P)-dependent oxidoreductase [Gammaproteobacteria bacterium]
MANPASFLESRLGLTGRFAIIVGGGGGLGRASAVDLARAGVVVALCDRNQELLDETVAGIRADGGAVALAQVLDARDPEALGRFFADCDAHNGGRLDILVNVVGGTFHQPFADTNARGWDALIRTNFTWLLHATHLAIPRMRKTGRGGSIMSFTSIEGHRAAPGFAVYAGMKAAVENFTRTLAVELAPERIRVNTIAPDITPTEGIRGISGSSVFVDDGGRAQEINEQVTIPMGRYGVYEDVGGAVLFLASDLSRYVTGTAIHPDGGTFASAGWFNWPGTWFKNSPPDSVAKFLAGKE